VCFLYWSHNREVLVDAPWLANGTAMGLRAKVMLHFCFVKDTESFESIISCGTYRQAGSDRDKPAAGGGGPTFSFVPKRT
jgi:hypothetical protein